MKKFTVAFALVVIFAAASLFRQTSFWPRTSVTAFAADAYDSPEHQQMAQEILRSTVRIHLRAWRVKEDESGYFLDESIGHATLRDGRYLLSHNHYSLLDKSDLAVSVAIFNSNGQYLFSAPLSDFQVTQVGAETRLFELRYDFLQQQLAAAGITSANFADWRTLNLHSGMSVAQIDWDGNRTRVDWTRIEEVLTRDGVPRIVLSDSVAGGGSGGGVFLNGHHIANNWQAVDHFDRAGNVVNVTSVAALNA